MPSRNRSTKGFSGRFFFVPPFQVEWVSLEFCQRRFCLSSSASGRGVGRFVIKSSLLLSLPEFVTHAFGENRKKHRRNYLFAVPASRVTTNSINQVEFCLPPNIRSSHLHVQWYFNLSTAPRTHRRFQFINEQTKQCQNTWVFSFACHRARISSVCSCSEHCGVWVSQPRCGMCTHKVTGF